MWPNQNRPFNRSAFTLAEAMTGVAIICLVFTVLHLGIAQGLAAVRNCRETLRASQILEERMETVRLYKWEDINTPGFVKADVCADSAGIEKPCDDPSVYYTGTLTVSPSGVSETYNGDLKLFVATLDWTSGGVTHHREMRTFASRWGLQNYVYPIK